MFDHRSIIRAVGILRAPEKWEPVFEKSARKERVGIPICRILPAYGYIMDRADLLRLSKEELVLSLQRPGGAKPGHEGHSRSLHESPDAFEDHAPIHCDQCGAPFAADATRELIGEYDEIEITPIIPSGISFDLWSKLMPDASATARPSLCEVLSL